MPQIFKRSANTVARASLVGVLLLAGGTVGLLMVIGVSSSIVDLRIVPLGRARRA